MFTLSTNNSRNLSLRRARRGWLLALAPVILLAAPTLWNFGADPEGSGSDEEPIDGKVAIIDMRADVARAASLEPVEITLRAQNTSKRKLERVWLEVRTNGMQRFEAPPILTLPPGTSVHTFKIRCKDVGFNHIEAYFEKPKMLRDPSPIEERKRYAVVKVEDPVRVLIVDGDYTKPPKRKDGTGDPSKAGQTTGTFYLRMVLESTWLQVDSGTVEDIEKATPGSYSCVYLLNVPELSKPAVENLEGFVQAGGGLCVFLGDKVKADQYNKSLFKDGKGLLPVPLDPEVRKLQPENEADANKARAKQLRRINAGEPSLHIRDASHPMFARYYSDNDPERRVDRFLTMFEVKQYFAIDPARFKKLADADKPDVLFSLPNQAPVDDYKARAFKLINSLPVNDEKFEKWNNVLEGWQKEVKQGIAQESYQDLFELARAFDRVLNGRVSPAPEGSGARGAELAKFWADPANAGLRKDFQQFVDDARFGDPFVVSRRFGKGQVAACLSSANDTWNNWPTSPYLWISLIPALHKHVSTLADAPGALCGKPITITADPKKYGTNVKIYKVPASLPEEQLQLLPEESDPEYETKFGWTLVESTDMTVNKDDEKLKGQLVHKFTKNKEPGIYVIVKQPLAAEGEKAVPERRAIAVNVDLPQKKGSSSANVELPKPDADGFVTIFNGKNLDGWDGLEDYWSVKEGVISGHETKENSKQTFLVFSAMKLSDFELHCKYKFATEDGNSGIQFRSKVLDDKTFSVGGYQADCDAKGGYDGTIYDEAGVAGGRNTMSNRGEKTTWDADNQRKNEKLEKSGDELKKLIKIGDWNDVVLVAKGNHITYTINGQLMTDLTDDSPKALKDGVLAFQLHAGYLMEIQFKDVKVKVLEK